MLSLTKSLNLGFIGLFCYVFLSLRVFVLDTSGFSESYMLFNFIIFELMSCG